VIDRNGNLPPVDEARLDAYLDGRLHPAEAAIVEQLVVHDSRAQGSIALQRRIDAAIRIRFTPPAAIRIEGLTTETHASPVVTAGRKLQPWRMAAAAALVLATIGVYANWYIRSRPPAAAPFQPVAMGEAFASRLAGGFQPEWVCESDEIFRETFEYRLGRGVTLLPSAGVEMVGMGYDTTLSPSTVSVLMRVDGREVMLFVDRLKTDTRTHEAPPGLKLHRREVAPLVVYELSPFDEARVLHLVEVHAAEAHSCEGSAMPPMGFLPVSQNAAEPHTEP
jgi:hypothetical protein